MVDPQQVQADMLAVLESRRIPHQVFHHRPVLSYEDAEAARRDTGMTGREGKVAVCRTDQGYAVYITSQGKRFDARALKRLLGVKKLRMATEEELREHFGAEPGSAYPFGFPDDVPIAVDPSIYAADQVLFSMPLPTSTLQIGGRDLRRLIASLANPTVEAAPA